MKRILLSEKIKKAPRFLTIEPYLRKQDHPIASHPEARQPRIVPLVVIDYGSLAARIKQMRYIGKLLLGAVGRNVEKCSQYPQKPVQRSKDY